MFNLTRNASQHFFSGLDVNMMEREAAEGSEVGGSNAISPRPSTKYSTPSASGGGGVDEAHYMEQQRVMATRRGGSVSPVTSGRPTSASSGQQTPTALMPLDQLLSTPSFDESAGNGKTFSAC
jgi:hypothetical protein